MANRETQYPAIPEPTTDVAALYKTIKALKEAVEILTGQRGRNVESVDTQLRDLRSTRDGLNARFMEYVEVSTADNKALAQRITNLDAESTQGIADVEAHITEVETAMASADGALAERASTLEAKMDGSGAGSVNARLSTVDQARVDGDAALAGRIDNLDASYGTMSASGRISFQAIATPSGASAAYEIFVKASDGGTPVEAGLKILAKTDGTGAILLTASQFQLDDPTLGPTPVFTYSGGYFQFNVPVNIHGSQLESNATFSFNAHDNQDLSLNVAQTAITVRAGAIAIVDAEFGGRPDQPFSATGPVGYMAIERKAASAPDSTFVEIRRRTLSLYVANAGSTPQRWYIYTRLKVKDDPGAGAWTYRVVISPAQGPTYIDVEEKWK